MSIDSCLNSHFYTKNKNFLNSWLMQLIWKVFSLNWRCREIWIFHLFCDWLLCIHKRQPFNLIVFERIQNGKLQGTKITLYTVSLYYAFWFDMIVQVIVIKNIENISNFFILVNPVSYFIKRLRNVSYFIKTFMFIL